MKTVHLIFNAHIDPIWLWPWHAGLAEVLSTARSVCDQLDECDDLIFTRGESWFHKIVQQHDPELFERIRKHVANGRWEIVGGWYVQPDCNQPSYWGLEKQVQLGKQYFEEKFGIFPQTAYNVDSFGHAATLPRLMHDAGQHNYIMMRPQENEKELPARLFRWQGQPDGPIITTFRIARAYCTPKVIGEEHVLAGLSNLPEGINHTMSFLGVGDHGGGPSREMTQWCREHAHAFDGVELVFSSPSRFFAAIADDLDKLPLVQGELQHHAIGCYSVDRPTKVLVRKAEHALRAAESVTTIKDEPAMQQAWEHVCFHHFHDTLGGTCIPSAYSVVHAQLGSAQATTDHLLRHETMQRSLQQGPDTRQRIVLYNPTSLAFDGYLEIEPWLEHLAWQKNWRLENAQGQSIIFQRLVSEALAGAITRLMVPCHIQPNNTQVLYINTSGEKQLSPQPQTMTCSHMDIANILQTTVRLGLAQNMTLAGMEVPLPRLVLQHETTDTWSHNTTRYDEAIAAEPRIEKTIVVDKGPLMMSLMQYGRIGESRFEAQWRAYTDQPTITLDLHVEWVEQHRVLKLVWDLPTICTHRMDGIPGSVLHRECDGRERPVRDLTQIHMADENVLGVSCPDIFALDGSEKDVRFTLLRSPIMAHHDPHNGIAACKRYSDRGTHDFHFVFAAGDAANVDHLERLAMHHWQPPLSTDLTLGMTSRISPQD